MTNMNVPQLAAVPAPFPTDNHSNDSEKHKLTALDSGSATFRCRPGQRSYSLQCTLRVNCASPPHLSGIISGSTSELCKHMLDVLLTILQIRDRTNDAETKAESKTRSWRRSGVHCIISSVQEIEKCPELAEKACSYVQGQQVLFTAVDLR